MDQSAARGLVTGRQAGEACFRLPRGKPEFAGSGGSVSPNQEKKK